MSYALAVFYAQGGQQAQALEWANKLLALNPADPQARQLVQRLLAGFLGDLDLVFLDA